ncbi:hypothetical protein MHK_006902 [Candidatus Magnetomorum sp. HK-1]|nr:hypothetical protein MHK_006902 [Candidatus Magnetomorum sp. HK-1]
MYFSKQILTLFILFLIISNISCITTAPGNTPLHQREIENKYKVPVWFIQKPQISGVNLVYAYAPQYLNKATEKKKLLYSAAESIAKYKKVRLNILQEGRLQTGKYLSNTQELESDVTINEETLEEKYSIICQYPIGSGIIALAAETAQLKTANLRIINKLKKLKIDSPPKWVVNPPFEKGFVYAVGSAQDHSSPEKAWKVAEKNARANLALQISSTMQFKNNDIQTSMWEWLVTHHQISSSMVLKNVSIIKHGYHEPSRTYYALARMPTKHIHK